MRCPILSELPPPPPDKTGWPWTDESRQLEPTRPDGDSWPGITVVTPSLNYGKFIEETIRSVLLQGYPNLEYIILDGGSSDDSVEIIKKYSSIIYMMTTVLQKRYRNIHRPISCNFFYKSSDKLC